MRVIALITGVQGYARVSSVSGLGHDKIQQQAGISFLALRRQGAQVVDVKVFAMVQILEIPVSYSGDCTTLLFDESQDISFLEHLLHRVQNGFVVQVRPKRAQDFSAFGNVFPGGRNLNIHSQNILKGASSI